MDEAEQLAQAVEAFIGSIVYAEQKPLSESGYGCDDFDHDRLEEMEAALKAWKERRQ